MKDKPLSIVLPVYNEEQLIEGVIREIDAQISRMGLQAEIIAVNDGSQDGTGMVLSRLTASLTRLKVVTHGVNKGYGGALVSGIKAAGHEWVLLMDADGQFKIGAIEEMLPYGAEHDFILGYRQKRADAWHRLLLGRLGNSCSNLLLGRYVKDINCGYKLFKTSMLQGLDLQATGGSINFEILYKLFRKFPKARYHQMGIVHYPRTIGVSTGAKPKVLVRIVTEGLKVIFSQKS